MTRRTARARPAGKPAPPAPRGRGAGLEALAALQTHPLSRALVEASAGSPVHLVGGVLRDRLLGISSDDFDAVVAGGRGAEIAGSLERRLPARLVRLGGDRFAALRLVAGGGLTLDLWDREETSLEEDLARRDFTVNALALPLPEGKLVDPFGGLGDLERRLLRATSERSFRDDPLRVVRLPRLAAVLPGFTAEPATLELARTAAAEVGGVAAERVREELARLFASPGARRGLALATAVDLYPGLWLGRPGEAGDGTEAVRCLGELPGVLGRLRQVAPALFAEVEEPLARLALTFTELPGSTPAAFRQAGYLAGRPAARVEALLACADLPEDDLGRRHFLHRAGDLWPTAIAVAGTRAVTSAGPGTEARLLALVDLARRSADRIAVPPRLVSGREVGEILGEPPGPRIGEALAALTRAQVEGRVETREQAVRFVEGLRS